MGARNDPEGAHLYSVSTKLTIEFTTLVRANTPEEAGRMAAERPLESTWHKELPPGEGALTHWLQYGVPAHMPRPSYDTLPTMEVRKL